MAALGAVLVTGGPGSGKTDEVVARLAARYESDPLYEAAVLVPTSRHGDQFRKRLVARCGVALRLRVETIHRFSQSLSGGGETVSRTVAEELLTAVARREARSGSAAYFSPIAHTEGFIDLISAAVERPAVGRRGAGGSATSRPPVRHPSSDGAELHLRLLLLGAGPPRLAPSGKGAVVCGRRLEGGSAGPRPHSG